MDEEVRGTLEQSEKVDMVEENVTMEGTAAEEENITMEESFTEKVNVEMEDTAAMNVPNPEEKAPAVDRQEVWRHALDSPYSPLYVPDKKQTNKNKLTIFIVIVLLICLVCGLIAAVAKLVEAAMGEVSDEISVWKETYNEFIAELEEEPKENGDDTDMWSDREVVPDDSWWDDFEEYDEYDSYDDYYEEYIPSPEDEYYVEIVDSIREDLSYSVEKEEYLYTDDDTAVSVFVEYVVVDGDNLAFKDKINETLEDGAMYYVKEFASESVTDLTLYVESYVTYMDEDILSVVVDEQYYWGYEVAADLYCMNFDMKTGTLLYNTDIIEPTEELAEAFRDMSDYQNGSIDHIDEISDEDICAYMSDEDYLILFYTPVGLEVGFNYYEGWVTATLKEYEKYLRKL